MQSSKSQSRANMIISLVSAPNSDAAIDLWLVLILIETLKQSQIINVNMTHLHQKEITTQHLVDIVE